MQAMPRILWTFMGKESWKIADFPTGTVASSAADSSTVRLVRAHGEGWIGSNAIVCEATGQAKSD